MMMGHSRTTGFPIFSHPTTSRQQLGTKKYFILIYRVKDNIFVFCAMKYVIDGVLEAAQKAGVSINQIIFKVL